MHGEPVRRKCFANNYIKEENQAGRSRHNTSSYSKFSKVPKHKDSPVVRNRLISARTRREQIESQHLVEHSKSVFEKALTKSQNGQLDIVLPKVIERNNGNANRTVSRYSEWSLYNGPTLYGSPLYRKITPTDVTPNRKIQHDTSFLGRYKHSRNTRRTATIQEILASSNTTFKVVDNHANRSACTVFTKSMCPDPYRDLLLVPRSQTGSGSSTGSNYDKTRTQLKTDTPRMNTPLAINCRKLSNKSRKSNRLSVASTAGLNLDIYDKNSLKSNEARPRLTVPTLQIETLEAENVESVELLSGITSNESNVNYDVTQARKNIATSLNVKEDATRARAMSAGSRSNRSGTPDVSRSCDLLQPNPNTWVDNATVSSIGLSVRNGNKTPFKKNVHIRPKSKTNGTVLSKSCKNESKNTDASWVKERERNRSVLPGLMCPSAGRSRAAQTRAWLNDNSFSWACRTVPLI